MCRSFEARLTAGPLVNTLLSIRAPGRLVALLPSATGRGLDYRRAEWPLSLSAGWAEKTVIASDHGQGNVDDFCRDDTEHAAEAWGLPEHRSYVMSSTESGSSRSNARVAAARNLVKRKGVMRSVKVSSASLSQAII